MQVGQMKISEQYPLFGCAWARCYFLQLVCMPF